MLYYVRTMQTCWYLVSSTNIDLGTATLCYTVLGLEPCIPCPRYKIICEMWRDATRKASAQ